MSEKPKASPANGHWTDRLKTLVPTRETLAAHPWLKPIAHRLLDPGLWQMQHEAVARGAAIGMFWAFALPVAQVVAAVAHSVWWRANIPVAAGLTFITNPLTVGFWLWLAYKLGSLILGTTPPGPQDEAVGILAWVASFGAPTLLGMGIFAISGAVLGYLAVKFAWLLRVWFRRFQRRKIERSGT